MADVTISGLGDLTPAGGLLLPVSNNSTTGKVTIDGAINTIGSRTSSLNLPIGTSAQRPASPANGAIRFNTTKGVLEVYYAGNWLSIASSTLIASGGTIVEAGGYKYHTFLSSGTFTVTSGSGAVEALIIGGGGSGVSRGGGGAGGLVAATTTVAAGSYNVVVGGGGQNSSFNNLVAFAGGNGGTTSAAGGKGGCGGGGMPNGGTSGNDGPYAGGAGSQGQNGGSGYHAKNSYVISGGGGGNTGVGGSAGNVPYGGAGTSAYSAWGLATNTGHDVGGVRWYCGGGGGFHYGYVPAIQPTGGNGGGGQGAGSGVAGATSGMANTGGGGGGDGGSGGSGIVIIRYLS